MSAPGFATVWRPDDPEPSGTFATGVPLAVRLRPGAGRFTAVLKDHDGTRPPPRIAATLTSSDGTWSYKLPIRFDGTIDLAEMPPGHYRLRLNDEGYSMSPRPTQWYPATLSSADAGLITITDGQTTAIAESMAIPATVEVLLRDALSGAPITEACVTIRREVCGGGTDGVYRDLLDFRTSSSHVHAVHLPDHFTASTSVTAAPGKVTQVTLKMEPGAVIATTYRDGTVDPAATDPVCVYTAQGRWGTEFSALPVCAMPAADGALRLGPFRPGWVQLFVAPRGAAGAQWLGYHGGTGDRRNAAVISLSAGVVTTAPAIVPARSGSVHGVLRHGSTGEPAVSACAVAGPGLVGCSTQGHYTLDRLGPYQWTIDYSSNGLLKTWSGRSGAPRVQLVSGQSTVADVSFPSSALDQTVEFGGPAGTPLALRVFDAWTGRELLDRYDVDSVVGLVPRYEPVTVQLEYDGERCWAYFTEGRRMTPYFVAGGREISMITLTPGVNCLPGEPPRLPAPVRGAAKGPVFVSMFTPAPAPRGGPTAHTGAAPSPTGRAVVSPWGRPSVGMMARVKP
ncbi:hypothetical protein [Catellatospora sp. NPDC049609]|uniref:hypothetical protein n=1 Tax=Catellatospora sp. NPDC049609 TaxID=3155505 RepID=UPI0034473DF8